jgi:hypothetical protein
VSKGGDAIKYWSSLRIRGYSPVKNKEVVTVGNKKIERVVGITTRFKVIKSSISKGYGEADVYIDPEYGIDDLRMNLQFVKDYTTQKDGKANSVYVMPDLKHLHKEMNEAIKLVEEDNLEEELKKGVVSLWHEIEERFSRERKEKVRL